MESPNPVRQILTVAKIVIKFLLGAAIGLLLVVIIYSNFQFSIPVLVTIQMICSCLFVIICGVFSAIWGSKFLTTLFQGLLEILSYLP
jgi:hypothetical protein